MSAAAIVVTVDDKAVHEALKRLADRGANLRPVLDEIGEHLLETTQHRFSERQGPDGEAWPAVSAKYAARKAAGKATREKGDARTRDPADLLLLTHHLFDNMARQTDANSVTVGSPEVYAATHQFGRGAIPARPFLGASTDDLRAILGLLQDHLDG